MRQLLAFSKKEGMELVRTGKLWMLMILFALFGIMNPAVAKITPWLMDMMADSMADTGMTVTVVNVDAMTSWTQFYKNMPLAGVIFLLLFSGIVTAECQKGTLIPMVTKGLERWKVVTAKSFVLLAVWTGGYWMSYGITYGYNAWFWDNAIVQCPAFAAFCLYLTGVWMISLLVMMSALLRSGSGALAAAGVIALAVYLAGLIPAVKEYTPVYLMSSAAGLLSGAEEPGEYLRAMSAVIAAGALNFAAAVICFEKKNI